MAKEKKVEQITDMEVDFVLGSSCYLPHHPVISNGGARR